MDDANMFSCGEHGGRNLHVIINFLLLVSSLVLVGTGAALMGFYRIHMLEIITIEFLIVPLFLLIGGILALITAIFGMYTATREDSCLMITYSVFLALQFLLLIGGIVAAVRLIFDIQIGLFDGNVVPELSRYETDSWVKYKWDTMQREFSCCGGYSFSQGYIDWKHAVIGSSRNSVPDSCCLNESPGCGQGIFELSDLRVVIRKIHIHGCIDVMLKRLSTHVTVILLTFSIAGGLLAMVELLGVVLACCMASSFAHAEQNDDYWDNDFGGGVAIDDGIIHRSHPSGRATPQTMMSNDHSSQHETAF
jgi:CD63 antigen